TGNLSRGKPTCNHRWRDEQNSIIPFRAYEKRGFLPGWSGAKARNPKGGIAESIRYQTSRSNDVALDQERIAELVGAIVARRQFAVHIPQRRIIGERAKQFVVAGTGFMGTCKEHIDHAQSGRRADPLCR